MLAYGGALQPFSGAEPKISKALISGLNSLRKVGGNLEVRSDLKNVTDLGEDKIRWRSLGQNPVA